MRLIQLCSTDSLQMHEGMEPDNVPSSQPAALQHRTHTHVISPPRKSLRCSIKTNLLVDLFYVTHISLFLLAFVETFVFYYALLFTRHTSLLFFPNHFGSRTHTHTHCLYLPGERERTPDKLRKHFPAGACMFFQRSLHLKIYILTVW